MLLIVWIVVVVLALVVLGGVAYGVIGAFTRLGREVASLQREVAPVLEQAQAASVRAAESRERRTNENRTPHSGGRTSARGPGSEGPPA